MNPDIHLGISEQAVDTNMREAWIIFTWFCNEDCASGYIILSLVILQKSGNQVGLRQNTLMR